MALAMDRRFGSLKTVGERKAAFNEYIQHKRKEEAEAARQERLKVRKVEVGAFCSCPSTMSDLTFVLVLWCAPEMSFIELR